MDEKLIKAALALDPNLVLPPQAEPQKSDVHVQKVLTGYDRDGEPVYLEHAFIGGKTK